MIDERYTLSVPHTCIVIVGATAVGKTAFAINLAKTLQTQIISADSRQCYRELNIGVGKPSAVQLESVKHYFVNTHSIKEEVNAAVFEEYALAAVNEIFQNSSHAIVAGGTGLYIDAFCNGLDVVPVILPEVRAGVVAGYGKKGLPWLQDELKKIDADFFMDGEILNPRRLMRALEVKLSTGRSIRSYHSPGKKHRQFKIVRIGLELPRDILNDQINRRVDIMLQEGLEEEVRKLIEFKHLNALNTVGYKELFDFFDGHTSFAQAVDLIKKHTRQYAKRQMTWFKKDQSVKWIHPDNQDTLPDLLKL